MDISLDGFLMAVRASLLLAQASLERQNGAKTAVIRDMAQRQFYVAPHPGDQEEVLSVSEASLRGHREHQVSMLSLSMACRFNRAFPFTSSRGGRLNLLEGEAANRWFGRRSLARVRIVFKGTSRPEGEAWLNETLLAKLPWEQEDLKTENVDWQKGSLFVRLWQWLHGGRGNVFSLNPEQTEKAQQILQQ